MVPVRVWNTADGISYPPPFFFGLFMVLMVLVQGMLYLWRFWVIVYGKYTRGDNTFTHRNDSLITTLVWSMTLGRNARPNFSSS